MSSVRLAPPVWNGLWFLMSQVSPVTGLVTEKMTLTFHVPEPAGLTTTFSMLYWKNCSAPHAGCALATCGSIPAHAATIAQRPSLHSIVRPFDSM